MSFRLRSSKPVFPPKNKGHNIIKYTYLSDEPSSNKIGSYFADAIDSMWNNYDSTSAIFYAPAVSSIYTSPKQTLKYTKYYRKCEYCGTINNVSYEINNCEACNAQFGLVDFLDNIRIAESILPTNYSENSEYKRLALCIIENAFEKHITYHKHVNDIITSLSVLSDEKIIKLMDYLTGFFKPDTLFSYEK